MYEDNLTRFFVDVADLPAHREFFKQFKEKLKRRFNQFDAQQDSRCYYESARRRFSTLGPVVSGLVVP